MKRPWLIFMAVTCLGVLQARLQAADYYVATNATPSSPYNTWTGAYTNLQEALNAARSNDTLYVAGHLIALTNQLSWTGLASYVSIRGGYAATNDTGLPGARDISRWPTLLKANDNVRVLSIVSVTNAVLDGVTLTGGGINSYGGGVYALSAVDLVISDCTITNNRVKSASNLYGAGLYVQNSSIAISNCWIRDNNYNQVTVFSGGYGGGLSLIGGTATVRNCVFLGNNLLSHSTYGAGIYINGGTHLIRNCLIANNDSLSYAAPATIQGDGIQVDGAAANVRIENCTIAGNNGEGIRRTAGTVMVTNSILWRNIDDLVGVSTGGVGYCNIEDADNLGTNNCFSADPQWERGYYLSAASPCINAGSQTAADAGVGGQTTRTDGTADADVVDLGYHYPAGLDAQYADLYVATNGNDINSGTNWIQALRTITQATRLARAGTRIHVAEGHYTNGSEQFPLRLGSVGLQLLGTNRDMTVINASGSGSRVMELSTGGGDSRIEGVTIYGGSGGYAGSGLYVYRAYATIADCLIISNLMANPGSFGGGIYAAGSFLTISNCSVRKNRAQNWGGGSIAYGGGFYVDGGEMLLRDTVVSGNKSYGSGSAHGGGLYITGAGSHQIVNCLITENELELVGASGHGAGICVNDGTVAVDHCTIGGHADEGIKRVGGTVTVSNSILWANTDDISGTMGLSYSCIQDGDSNGVNGCISSDPLWVGGYRLGDGSPCLNTGSMSAASAGLDGRTTRLDGSPDTGTVDLGYHYPIDLSGLAYMDLYVAGTGSDANSGTNAAEPLRSITKALTQAMDGSRIHVAGGLYTNGVETFPLTFPKQGIQLLGTNTTTTLISAVGASRRVLTLLNAGAGCRIQGVTITGGSGVYAGGGIYAQGAGLTVADCVITNNRMSSGGTPGGGIYASLCSLVVSNCLIANNQAYYWSGGSTASGGGIYAADGAALITHSIFTANSALGSGGGFGGGLCLVNQNAEIRNSLIYRNAAQNNNGAGLYVNGGNVQAINCTIVTNGTTGLQRAAGTVGVTNCIVWQNGDDLVGSSIQVGYSCIQSIDSFWTNGVNGCLTSDPQFEGMSTNNFHLAQNSPCRNVGLNLPAWMTGGVDLDGNPRIRSGVVDFGAYEALALNLGIMIQIQ